MSKLDNLTTVVGSFSAGSDSGFGSGRPGGRTILVENYGCQMNAAEAQSLLGLLEKGGWRPASPEEPAGVVLLNTCSVRKTAENRIWGRIGFYKRLKESRDFLLVVMGCMTQRLKDEIRREFPAVDVLVGTFGKGDFVQALLEGRVRPGDDFFGGGEYRFAPDYIPGAGDAPEAGISGPASPAGAPGKALVPIMHGCDNFCSYCIVPHVRGREISREPREIIAELLEMAARGIKEVTLLGQNVNSYRWAPGGGEGAALDFPGLLARILQETPLGWIRFISCHPKDLSPGLVSLMAENPRICRHLHLPVQHGSDKILSRMNRKYSRGDYLNLVETLRRDVPGISLTTDILVGFPGETLRDFQETLELLEIVGFEDAFMYYYNPIEGTPAFSMADQIEEPEKKRRLGELIALQNRLAREAKKARLDREALVLVEGISRRSPEQVLARTEQNHMVVFKGAGELTGRLCKVKLLTLKGNTFVGELRSIICQES